LKKAAVPPELVSGTRLSYTVVPTEVSHMLADRLEVRLDPDRRRKLAAVAEVRGAPVSAVVRELIDEAYEAIRQAERLRAAQEIGQMQLEDVPDPETLSRQLDRTYELTDLR
jgi:uncharacterized protein (DUF1778 family)